MKKINFKQVKKETVAIATTVKKIAGGTALIAGAVLTVTKGISDIANAISSSKRAR